VLRDGILPILYCSHAIRGNRAILKATINRVTHRQTSSIKYNRLKTLNLTLNTLRCDQDRVNLIHAAHNTQKYKIIDQLRRIGARINGEFRADDFTIVAIHTAVGLQHLGGVISFLVEPFGESQDVAGAKLDTISAPFAPVLYDMNDAFGDVDDLGIQGYAPELHGACPY
jgi:hypothetical protein